MFDWEDLHYFAAFVEEGTLSAAAARLGVEHATVARRIASLEAATGLKLVDRRSGRYRLTPAGNDLAEVARRMESEARTIDRLALARRQPGLVEVSVSAPPVIASRLIAPRLGDLRRDHPEIRLRLMSEAHEVSLVRGEADIAVRLKRPTGATLVARKVGSIAYRLYAAPGYLSGRDEQEVAFLSLDDSLGSAPHQIWMRARAGNRPVVLRTNDLSVQCAAVRAGLGVAVLPQFLAEAEGLHRADSTDAAILREVWLAWHEDLRRAEPVDRVVRFLADCLRGSPEMAASGPG